MLKQWKFIAVALVIATGSGQLSAQVVPGTDVPERIQLAGVEATVRIKTSDGKIGSGVCIGQRGKVSYILTAAHVIQGARGFEFDIFTADSFPRPARTYSPACRFWVDPATDLGLIEVSMPVPAIVRVCPLTTPLDRGTDIFTVGCDAGNAPFSRVGRLAGLERTGDLAVAIHGKEGRSGGGLFGPAGLMGVVSRGPKGGGAITICVAPDKIHDFVEGTGNGFLLP